MHKIFVELSENNFEYDIYSLVRAFYPGSEVKVYLAGEEPEGEYTLLLKVDYRPELDFSGSVEGRGAAAGELW